MAAITVLVNGQEVPTLDLDRNPQKTPTNLSPIKTNSIFKRDNIPVEEATEIVAQNVIQKEAQEDPETDALPEGSASNAQPTRRATRERFSFAMWKIAHSRSKWEHEVAAEMRASLEKAKKAELDELLYDRDATDLVVDALKSWRVQTINDNLF